MKTYLLNILHKQGIWEEKTMFWPEAYPRGWGLLPGCRTWFWEVTISVIVRKNVRMNICLILCGYRDRTVWMYKYNSFVNGSK